MTIKRFFLRHGVVTTLCLTLLASCWWYSVTLTTTRLAPGVIPLPGVHRLAVSYIDLDGDGSLQTALTRALLQVDGYTTIVGSTAVGGGYGVPAALGYDQVDAVVVGRIVVQHIHEDIEFEQLGDAGYTGVTAVRYSRRGIVTLEVALSVLDAQTGRILAQTQLRHVHSTPDDEVRLAEGFVRANSDILPLFPALDEARLLAEARYAVAQRFADQVAPHREAAVVTIYTLEEVPQSQWAKSAIEAGDWLQAIALFTQALDEIESRSGASDADRAKVYYNLGLAYGYAGYYPAAQRTLNISLWLDRTAQTRAVQRQIEEFEHEAKLRAAAFTRGEADFAL